MDVTRTSQRRLEVAAELFREGYSIAYQGVVFWKDQNRALCINSFSDWEPNNSNESMAKDKIARSKLVLAELMEKSPAFKEVAERLPHEYYFCYDYGMGSIALAKQVSDVFTWQYGKRNNG